MFGGQPESASHVDDNSTLLGNEGELGGDGDKCKTFRGCAVAAVAAITTPKVSRAQVEES